MDRQERIRLGGQVRRYHTRPVHNQQTVAAHSWGVAAILLDIVPPEEQSVALLRAALYHDVAEYDTGDVPAQAKWISPKLKDALDELEAGIEEEYGISYYLTLSAKDKNWLKIADLMELMWFVLEERRMGNRNVDEIFDRVWPKLLDLLKGSELLRPVHGQASIMLSYIGEEYLHVRK